MFTLFVVLTILNLLSLLLTLRWMWSCFGKRISLLRLWFSSTLPTKDNLLWRGILNKDSSASGCGTLEFVNHLFLHCSFFGSVWHHILCWVGLSTVAPFVRIVDKIKLLSFSWLKETFIFSFNYHGWWLSHFAMLGYE